MSIESMFPSAEALKVALDMDMDKGLERTVSQMAAVLAETPSLA